MVSSWKQIMAHQWTDELYNIGLDYLKTNKVSKKVKNPYHFKKKMNFYKHKDNTIIFEFKGELPWNKWSGRLETHFFRVIRPSERDNILNQFKKPEYLSAGINSLYSKIIQHKYLGISRNYVSNFVKTYTNLLIQNRKLTKPVIKSYRPLYPFQQWQMDIADMQSLAGLGNKGYEYILVIVDIFSKFTYAYPMKDKSATSVVAVLEHILFAGDIPERLQSDNDASFNAQDMKDILKQLSIFQIVNPSYSPQTNGFVENKIKHIKKLVELHFANYRTKRWIDVLPRIIFNINSTKHSVTKLSPLLVHRGNDRIISTSNNIVQTEYSDDISEYIKDQKSLVDSRNLYVRQEIDKIAKKRESKFVDTWEPAINSFVKVATTLKLKDGKILPIQLMYLDNNKIKRKKIYPTEAIPQAFRRKWVDKVFKESFKVSQKIIENSRPYFVLLDSNNNPIGHSTKENVFSNKFYPEMLVPILDNNKPKTPTIKTSDYIDPILILDKPKLPYTKDITVSHLLEYGTPRFFTGLEIMWVELVDQATQWFKGRIKNYKPSRPKNTGRWIVSFTGWPEQKEWYLDLDLTKYSTLEFKNNWYFIDKDAAIKKFIKMNLHKKIK